ncbi:helix-turn-helix transcriptional regulator [Pelomonas sp. APW6]|uniref:Helix-turn-helix transcriptional regulator n=1 Tax=Roseateles subflavus TaxID=3053353 RepID=A0ABT7LNH4_9BURK|nr:helix-turn-helix transcriptional regulator [Pelomonas sp. APW6]MDL5034417.1 helix-turn-helix transcriptional regulator [Pelomonas sp. APW6]
MPANDQHPAAPAAATIGRGLRQARQRRRESQEEAARRVGVAVSTWRRMEAGDPTVAWGVMLNALTQFGFEKQVLALGDPTLDTEGQMLDSQNLPKRVRRRAAAEGPASTGPTGQAGIP